MDKEITTLLSLSQEEYSFLTEYSEDTLYLVRSEGVLDLYYRGSRVTVVSDADEQVNSISLSNNILKWIDGSGGLHNIAVGQVVSVKLNQYRNLVFTEVSGDTSDLVTFDQDKTFPDDVVKDIVDTVGEVDLVPDWERWE